MIATATGIRIAEDLTLPLDAVTQAISILARRGAGKTHLARVLAEEMVRAGLQTVILDPLGAFWGLRSSADGQGDGLPITILGGEHGDVPLEPTAGRVIADVCVETTGSMILDLSSFESNAAQDRFVTDFAERLYRAKATQRRPLHLIVDEADSFAPQRVVPGQQRMLGAFEAIMRRGRIRGLGVTLITQRPAVLNKNCLTQTECLIVMQITAPQDRAAIDEWVRGNGTREERDEVMGSLAAFERGEAWVWSPSWLRLLKRVRIRQATTFDSSRTPEPGDITTEPQHMAPVDLDILRGRIAATIERAKADDPAELKRQLVELRKQLAERPAPAVVERVVEVPTVDRETALRLQELERENAQLKHWNEHLTGKDRDLIHKLFDRVVAMRAELLPVMDRYLGVQDEMAAARRERATPRAALNGMPSLPSQAQAPAPKAVPDPLPNVRSEKMNPAPDVQDARVTGPQQRILNALASFAAIGIATPARSNVAIFADASPTSSSYGNNLGALRTAGLIDYPTKGTVTLTDAGRELAVGADGPRTLAELHNGWCDKLRSGPQARILRVLIAAYPQAVDRDDLAEQAGASPSSSSYGNNLGRLRSLGLVDYPTRGQVVATALLFPAGLH